MTYKSNLEGFITLPLDVSSDSSVRSWRPLSRKDNPLFFCHLRNTKESLTQQFPIHKKTQY